MLGIAWPSAARPDRRQRGRQLLLGRPTLHPFLGFLTGWALVVSATIFMVAGSLPAGAMTLSLFDADLAENTALATAVGAAWFLAMLLVVAGGPVTVRAQLIMSGVELVLLVLFVVLGRACSRRPGRAAFDWSWLGFSTSTGRAGSRPARSSPPSTTGAGTSRPISARRPTAARAGPGSGLIGVLVVFLLFEPFTIAMNMILTPEDIRGTRGNVLAVLGDAIWPGVGGKLLIVAVMLSTVATLETTLIQVTRSLFAMGRDHTMPAALGTVHPVAHPVGRSPWSARWRSLDVRRLQRPGLGRRRPRGRGRRDRSADRVLLRARRAAVVRLPQPAVRSGPLRLRRPVAAARRPVHVLGLHRVAERARQRPRSSASAVWPSASSPCSGTGPRAAPTTGRSRWRRSPISRRLPRCPPSASEVVRKHPNRSDPTATSPAPRFAAQGTSAVLACPRPSPAKAPMTHDSTTGSGTSFDFFTTGALPAPVVDEAEAAAIAAACFGLEVRTRSLGSQQDANFLLEPDDGVRARRRPEDQQRRLRGRRDRGPGRRSRRSGPPIPWPSGWRLDPTPAGTDPGPWAPRSWRGSCAICPAARSAVPVISLRGPWRRSAAWPAR